MPRDYGKRNYNAEIAAKIVAAIPDWEYVPSLIAKTVVEDLQKNDPELLEGWLHEMVIPFVATLVTEVDKGRHQIRSIAVRGEFAKAAKQFEETGDVRFLQPFLPKRD